jgi:hypothetical protein
MFSIFSYIFVPLAITNFAAFIIIIMYEVIYKICLQKKALRILLVPLKKRKLSKIFKKLNRINKTLLRPVKKSPH